MARQSQIGRGRWVLALSAALAATALGGCGLGIRLPADAGHGARTNSGSPSPSAAAATTTAPTVHSNEIPTPPGRTERAPLTASAQLALRRFAGVYVNWDAADVKAHLTELAADSVGQARTAMALQAAQTGADPELRAAGIANRGTVEAVAPLAGSGHRYVVVTLETTSATDSSAYQGLAAAWHLTVATVARRDGGWVISGWQPES